MGTRIHKVSGLIVSLIFTCHLVNVAQSSKVWGEVPLPEDLDSSRTVVQRSQRFLDDDEDFAANEASGDLPSGEEDGSTPEPTVVTEISTTYYRALVNFTDSIVYRPDMEDIYSLSFEEISDAVVDTLESEYNKISGIQTVNVVLIKKMPRQNGVDVFVELDVGSDYNNNENQIRNVLYGVVKEGTIASYITSVQGFQFRRLGEVVPNPLPCMKDEHTCQDGGCIPLEYLCDNRPDCNDMSDELDCDKIQPGPVTPTPPTTTTPPIRKSTRPLGPPDPLGPCKVDQATCQNGECVPRDYLCDGERDCSDGSDEFRCGTPSPCEPNEFKCKNGRCALKLWRCDGDNDCEDNSDETNCPTRGPGDTCAPEQFVCLSDRTCIPSSYQCDEEPDCPDRSDEYGCTPPTVTSPPEESIEAERGETVTFNCVAVGVPTPIITWRLNWGHIPISGRISMTSENGRGSLTIRDVKEADQGAYTCEAINAKGLVFGIPDGVLSLTQKPGNCPDGHFSVEGRCISCFCFGITKNCGNTGRYRNQINLRFTDEDDFKGVNVTYPSRPGTPPLSSTQLLINPEEEEFQLVDLSRRFLILDSFWTLPHQFLGNKIDSYGGSLKYKVRYTLARGETEPEEKPDVVLTGNGQRLVYRRGNPTPSREVNQKEIKFTEDNWQHSSGRQVSREDLMMTLASLESISIRTVYDNHMVSVALSDIVMDTTTVEYNIHDNAKDVEECRCPPGYSGLSCEQCSTGFERVSGGNFLGSCAGCNCNGHASACDPISGQCLSCQHNTEGPQCDKCRPGYFGDPRRGRPDDCKPCPCPYTETSRRFSDTCFLDHDSQATCDACTPGYTGRRCEKCASGYQGNPLQPNGKCFTTPNSKCDIRGTVNSNSRPCACKSNVVGSQCDECKSGSFHLMEDNPEGCLQCFCMGVTKQCASSTWSRDQVRGGVNGQLFSLSNGANTRTITDGIAQRGSSEVVYRSFSDIPNDVYYWVLPDSFRGDKVTAYGGELRYTVRYEPRQRSLVIDRQPDVVLQGNGIFLEHFSQIKPLSPATVTVTFRESAWRRADGQPCTREHLLMALADTTVFMIRATYADNMVETSLSDIRMDIAVPHSTGNERALEVEECACPQGYNGPSCQECDVGYTRTGSGLYLGTCERCHCNGHASGCDLETGACLQCLHNTAGPRCERCLPGFYGNPMTDGPQACQSCPCPGTSPSNQYSLSCYKDADGQPTCDNCPPGFTGRRCERKQDSCVDPYLQEDYEGFLPPGCGEAVFNFSLRKHVVPEGSGDEEEREEDYDEEGTPYSPQPNEEKEEERDYSPQPDEEKEEEIDFSPQPDEEEERDYSPQPDEEKEEEIDFSPQPDEEKEKEIDYSPQPDKEDYKEDIDYSPQPDEEEEDTEYSQQPDEEKEEDSDYSQRPYTPTWSLLSTTSHRTQPTHPTIPTRPTTRPPAPTRPATHPTTPTHTTTPIADMVRVHLNRTAPRVPSLNTPSPEVRDHSFQFLMRLHMNRFNQRLSMLESNTLDIKEGIQAMRGQQSKLSTQLETLQSQSALEKKERVGELESSYTDMETRLRRLEGRLEIVIDGFTALAQEMNKVKRVRHRARSAKEAMALPPVSTALVPRVTTTRHSFRTSQLTTVTTLRSTVGTQSTTTRSQTRATVPKSLPTPRLPTKKTTMARKSTTKTVKQTTKPKPLTRSTKSNVNSKSSPRQNTTLSKPRTSSRPRSTTKPETKTTMAKKLHVTANKRSTQTSQSKPREAEEDLANTKYQLAPPSHKHKLPTQVSKSRNEAAKKEKDASHARSNDKKDSAFRSVAAHSKVQPNVKIKETVVKKPSDSNNGNSRPNLETTAPDSYQLAPPSHKVQEVSKAKTSYSKKLLTNTLAPTKTTSSSKRSRLTTKSKVKTTSSKRRPQKKKAQPQSNVLDLLKLIQRNDQKSSQKNKKQKQDGSFHIILGRLAIPIKIIPDY